MREVAMLCAVALWACDDGATETDTEAGVGASTDLGRPAPPGDGALVDDARVPGNDGAREDAGDDRGDGGPAEPVIATLEAPAEVGDCDVLVLDGSLSTGRRLRFAWTVDAPEAPGEALRALAAAEVGPVLVVPPGLLQPATTYGFAVSATDREGRSDTVRVEVTRKPLAPPAVSIGDGEPRTTTRGRPLVLEGEGRAPACDGRPRPLGFAWAAEPVLPDTAEAHGPRLELPPGVLEVGQDYVFTLSSWLLEAPETEAEASVEVAVLPGALQPVIAGGDREHPVDRDLTLDASGSLDPDSPPGEILDAADGYGFEWRCARDEGACALDLASEAIVVVPGRALELGGYVFTLVLGHGERSAEADARVKVVEAPCRIERPPVVAIARPAAPRVHPDRDLRLHAAVAPRGEMPPDLLWRETTGQLDLADRAVAPAGPGAPALLVSAAALEPGAALRFRLEATDCAGVGADELPVTVNAAPRGGMCRALPPEPEGRPERVVRCEGWMDEDAPLSFAFWFERDGLRLPLAPPGATAELTFRPPEGVERIHVSVGDALGLAVEVPVPL